METLADRVKKVEKKEAGRKADSEKPLMVRIDGKCFSKFTKENVEAPFCLGFCQLMDATAAFLMKETDAKMAYNQSDEITLSYYNNRDRNPNSQYMFGGKYQKLTSVLSSMATAFFNENFYEYVGVKASSLAYFDCRVWSVDSLEDVASNYLWRHRDWIRNSITMLARDSFSHKKLQCVSTTEMLGMLKQEGVIWTEKCNRIKYGNLLMQKTKEVYLSDKEIENIPESYKPVGPVLRNVIETFVIKREMQFDDFFSLVKTQYL